LFDWDNFIINEKYRDKLKDIFIYFYKNEALKYISERVQFFANNHNLVYNDIRISSAKWKWWSCSSKKNLTFVYNLILADKNIIDYVIVHELAHTKQMNHSKLFWMEVENMMSDYKKHRLWLKQSGNSLRF
jgi:predicted metal-dependent hydrolase